MIVLPPPPPQTSHPLSRTLETQTMSATSAAPAPAPAAVGASNPNSSAPRPRRGRGRGGRARQTANSAQAQTQTQTQAAPDAQPHTQRQPPTETTPNGDAPRPPRGPRGGNKRGGRGAGASRRPRGGDQATLPAGRTFGGRLTRPEQEQDGQAIPGGDGVDEAGLRADAPVFVPGVVPQQPREEVPNGAASASGTGRGKGKAKAKNNGSNSGGNQKQPRSQPLPPQAKVTTKSTASDIATRIHEDIAHNLYECPICTSELGKRSRVWSCGLCWTVFHLSCVKKWSRNEGAAAAQRQDGENGESSAPRAWRCPGCNLPQEVFPSTYTCWCEKEVDPRSFPGLPPHSCGQTCARTRKGCPHPCDATCHAGPCAPCTAMGPTQDCFCGRNSSTKRCQDTDYENGWSCGEICGDLLPCGEHTCPRPCHEGLCGSCEERIEARCYCGKVQTEMLCSSKDEELDSELMREDDIEEWTGCFSCGDECSRPFDCGVHFCQKSCHAQDAHPAHCPRSPDVVFDCPCGKTPLDQIAGYSPRTSCEDPIPNCTKPCGKPLACGHPCTKVCHTGSCGPCFQNVPIACRCGRNTFTTMCPQGEMEPPQCFRICKAGLHCGRHACTERCCPGEQKAIERQAIRRKLKSHLRPSDEDFEAEHICTRVCGRMLKCGRHTCPEICHKGPCNTCREAIFEEIPCNCGRSILHPPLPCGTQPPACSFPCERPKPCGHPQTSHNCHTDDESCPKCPYLTEKTCLCGKKVLKNQPCWLADARCGQVCGQLLKCGSHTCQKHCHRPGECEDATKPCQQACGKTKTMCGHPCTDPCHAPYPCPEKTPCKSMITVTCDCGRLRQERRCNAAKAVVSKGQLQQAQRGPAVTPLSCDDECARLERNRSLASALGVDINPTTTVSQSLTSTNLPYSAETLDIYIQLSSSHPLSTLQTIESTLHTLATTPTERSTRFQPAKSSLRAFTHSLAADWGFASESFDPEPHRHVFVLKSTLWTPPVFGTGNGTAIGIGGMSVGDCVKLRDRQRLKEQEAQRLAAAEAKAQREAARAHTNGSSEGGWAQVAASKRSNLVLGAGRTSAPSSASTSGTVTPAAVAPWSSSTMYAALDRDVGDAAQPKKEKLVLRSGVKGSRSQGSSVEREKEGSTASGGDA
ncbi:FKBP12-associated protein [Aspergillus tubingensis]|uniref:FKBP12-associated protein n=1 Tax=Aspergillus tubingensis TaxID=5068 RepID=A0A9W6AYP0_ASPTU|nr:FKBP12-associated protein [Aspergillus tubingensis]